MRENLRRKRLMRGSIDDRDVAQPEQRPRLHRDRYGDNGAVPISVGRTGGALYFLPKLQLRCADGGKDPRIVIAGAPERIEHGRKICRKPLRQSLAVRRRILPQFVKVRTILQRVFDTVIAVDHELDPVGQCRGGRIRRLIRAEKPEEIECRSAHWSQNQPRCEDARQNKAENETPDAPHPTLIAQTRSPADGPRSNPKRKLKVAMEGSGLFMRANYGFKASALS